MANINITSSGTYEMGDGDKAKIDISGGGTVTLQAAAGDDNVDKITIEFEDNDSQGDVVTVDLSTFDEDDLHIDIKDYDPSDQIILQGATITGVDPTDSSKLTFTYIGEDGSTYTGYAHLKDSGENDFTDPASPIIICFAKGTLIRTQEGEVPVEELAVGDFVITRDCGPQQIRWIGSRQLDSVDLAQQPDLYPIRIDRGALGEGKPSRVLVVSPQHRFSMGSPATQLLFGQEDVLVSAKHLVNEMTIRRDVTVAEVTYFHILFDSHQIVFSNGSPSESLHTGDMALSALDQETLSEILSLFPELAEKTPRGLQTVHPVLKAYEAQVMLADS